MVPDVSRHAEWLEMADEFGRDRIDGAAMESATLDELRDPDVFATWVQLLLDYEHGENLPLAIFHDRATARVADVSSVVLRDLTGWMIETGARSSAAMRTHHFERTRSAAEQSFLDTEVIAPFVAAHTAALKLFDVLGFAITLDGKVAIQPHLTGDTTAPPGGGPSPAELRLARGRPPRSSPRGS